MNHSCRAAVTTLSLLALCSTGCKSKTPAAPGSVSGPTVKVEPKPDPKPPARPDAGALLGAPLKPGEALPTVTIKVVNATNQDHFTRAGRAFAEALTVERQVEGKWVAVPYRLGTCGALCPADGSKPRCNCRPPRPAPGRIPAGKSFSVGWKSKLFHTRTLSASCFCQLERRAPAGRYRATACLFPSIPCDESRCDLTKPEPHFVLNARTTSGDKTCVSAEFTLGSDGLTVELAFKK